MRKLMLPLTLTTMLLCPLAMAGVVDPGPDPEPIDPCLDFGMPGEIWFWDPASGQCVLWDDGSGGGDDADKSKKSGKSDKSDKSRKSGKSGKSGKSHKSDKSDKSGKGKKGRKGRKGRH